MKRFPLSLFVIAILFFGAHHGLAAGPRACHLQAQFATDPLAVGHHAAETFMVGKGGSRRLQSICIPGSNPGDGWCWRDGERVVERSCAIRGSVGERTGGSIAGAYAIRMAGSTLG